MPTYTHKQIEAHKIHTRIHTHSHTEPLLRGETSAVCCSQIIDSSKQKVEGKTGISHADEIFTTCQPIQTNALLRSRTARQHETHLYHTFPTARREAKRGRE